MSSKKKSSQISVLLVYVATMFICLVVFGSCAVILMDIFVTQPAKRKADEAALKDKEENVAQVTEDHSKSRETILFIGANGETINGMALLRVLPDKAAVRIVPVSKLTLSEVSGTTGTIAGLYESGGLVYLKAAVENAFDIKCDKYIKITDDGWRSLVEFFGGTSNYTFPQELYYKNHDTGELTSFSQGPATRTLWGDDIRRIITYPLYENGERDKVRVIGEISVSLINSGFLMNGDEISSNLTNIFNAIFNNSDTDITTRSFKAVKPSYEFMLKETKSPAAYRMPQGSWDANGFFTLDPSFQSDIKEYFELD